MEEITENGSPALGTTLAAFAERYRSTENPEQRSVYQTDYLQQAMSVGQLPPEFLVENISSEEWYYAMMGLASRLRDADTLRAVATGMGHGIEATDSDVIPIVIGLDQTGIEVIKTISTTASVPRESLLAVDFDRYTLEQSDVNRQVTVPFGRVRFLNWAGVHHGGVDHRRMLSLAAVPEIVKELENSSHVIVTLALGGALGTGAAPVIAALWNNTDRPLQVVAILPLKLRPRKAIKDPLHWRESLHAVDLLQKLDARVDLLSSEKILAELPNDGQEVSLREFHKLMIAALSGRVVAAVNDNVQDST
jgi:hypothetical protein